MALVVRRRRFCPPKKEVTDGRMDQRTDEPADGRTDNGQTPSHLVVAHE